MVVAVPPLIPSYIDGYNDHWKLRIISCKVRIRTILLGGVGVCGWPDYHRRIRQQKHSWAVLCGQTKTVGGITTVSEESTVAYRTWERFAEGTRSSSTNNSITERNEHSAHLNNYFPQIWTIQNSKTEYWGLPTNGTKAGWDPQLVWPTVLDCHFGSGFGSKPNSCQIGAQGG